MLVKSVLPVVSDGRMVVLADIVNIVWLRPAEVVKSTLVVGAVLVLDELLLGLGVVVKF